MRAPASLAFLLVASACDPMGVWNDIQDGPDDDAPTTGEGEGEGDAGEGEGEGVGPLEPCCDSLDEVALPEGYDFISLALNRAGVAHAVFHGSYTGVGARPLVLGVASGGSFALETIEFDTPTAGVLGFDSDDRAVVTRGSSSGVSGSRRVSAGNWEYVDLFAAPGPPYVSTAFPPVATSAGIAVGIVLVTVEDPGEGSCPGGITSCSTYGIALGTEAGNRFVSFDIGASGAYPVAVGGNPGSFVVAWATTNGPSDVVVARETPSGDFATSALATQLGSAQVVVTPEGAVLAAGIEDAFQENPRLVLLEDGTSFQRTVLVEGTRVQFPYGESLALGADGAALVAYGLTPASDGSAPAELRLARKRGSERDDALVHTFPAGATLQNASVAADASGRAHVVWSEYAADVYQTHYLAP